MAKKIVVIGAGQLGSRHLQALALLEDPTDIYVVDPLVNSLNIANERFMQIEGHNKHEIKPLFGLGNMDEKKLDLVVVATNSGVRHQVVMELLSNFEVKFLLLEKFLFQRSAAYNEVEEKLAQTGTTCFVNCPRRMFPSYKKIKGLLKPLESLHMVVVGNNWGLGCNGIHFVDLFQWLTGEVIQVWTNELDPGFMESKRQGYIDFSGRISGKSENGHILSLICFKTGRPNISVRISTTSNRMVVSEGIGKYWHEQIGEQRLDLEEFEFTMLYQSQLTHIVAHQLFETGSCELTSYTDSVKTHLPFLEAMIKHYNKSQKTTSDLCPIT